MKTRARYTTLSFLVVGLSEDETCVRPDGILGPGVEVEVGTDDVLVWCVQAMLQLKVTPPVTFSAIGKLIPLQR